ncbi:hypothetical protein NUACC21_52270 [Scytonema sp. NUACC21]
MFVKILSYENLNDKSRSVEVVNPTWSDIRDAILKLDGHYRSSISLMKDEDDEYEEYMGIGGGGNSGLYICFISTQNPNDCDWQLYDPSKSSSDSVEIIAGQKTWFALNVCVGINEILKASEAYARFGKKDESLYWREYE